MKDAIERFADERAWKQYHDPKNLVMALASEVSELAEHFRWVTNKESLATATDIETASAVASELADVLMFALEFATVCHIDVATAIEAKLKVNETRYPVGKARGSNRKYDRL